MTPDPIACTRCGVDVTDELDAALQEEISQMYGGYNPMSISYAPPPPDRQAWLEEHRGRYVCRRCRG